jgi:arylsulfatase A-like enzyme
VAGTKVPVWLVRPSDAIARPSVDRMNRHLASFLAATALAVPAAVASTPAAEAAPKYSSCAKLTKDFKHGVAKSKSAAAKQVRAGYGRPSSSKRARKVYWANYKNLDRDRDGTACER